MTDIIIADGRELTALSLTQLAQQAAGCVNVSSAADFRSLTSAVDAAEKPLVIIDPETFDIGSVDRLALLVERFPKAMWLLVSMHPGRELLTRFSGHKRVGRALTSDPIAEILRVITLLTRHEATDTPSIGEMMASIDEIDTSLGSLTNVELEVLRLTAMGKTVKEIASMRASSVHTVITHKKKPFPKTWRKHHIRGYTPRASSRACRAGRLLYLGDSVLCLSGQ